MPSASAPRVLHLDLPMHHSEQPPSSPPTSLPFARAFLAPADCDTLWKMAPRTGGVSNTIDYMGLADRLLGKGGWLLQLVGRAASGVLARHHSVGFWKVLGASCALIWALRYPYCLQRTTPC